MTRKHWFVAVLVVCGLGLVAWAVLLRSADEPEDTAAAALAKSGAAVIRDHDRPGKPVIGVRLPPAATDAELKKLAPLKNLTTLDLEGTQVTETGLKELAPLKSLTTLKAPGPLTDGVLGTLRAIGLLHALIQASAEGGHRPARPEHVVKLDLSGTKVTGAGLAELAPLKNLTTLILPKPPESGRQSEYRPITDSELCPLREIGLLHALPVATAARGKRPARPDYVLSFELHGKEVTDEGLKGLAKFENLTTLDLHYTAVTDASLPELAKLSNLTTLNLQGTKVTVAGLRDLGKLKNLTTLNLQGIAVTDAGLRELAPLKSLHTLSLDENVLTDGVLRSLREIGLLHALSQASAAEGKRPTRPEDVVALSLNWAPVADAGLKEVVTLKNLKSLDLRGTKVTDAGLKELAPLKNLNTLHLGATKVTDAGLKELAPLKNLTTLHLPRELTDEVLRSLHEIGLLYALEQAKVDRWGDKRPTRPEDVVILLLDNTNVTDTGLKELAPLKNLTTLKLNREQVTDVALRSLREIGLLHALERATADPAAARGELLMSGHWQRATRPEEVLSLDLSNTKVTNAGLKELAPLTSLRLLQLYDTSVTDAGLAELVKLKNLRHLNLYDTSVTDAGLAELAKLTNLTYLRLPQKVTGAGMAELQKLLPKCKIDRGPY
jgi:Leucine-rich repeat (LRR) protein